MILNSCLGRVVNPIKSTETQSLSIIKDNKSTFTQEKFRDINPDEVLKE